MKMLKNVYTISFMLILLCSLSVAMRNPAATYCDALNYTYVVEIDSEGNDFGYCNISKDNVVDAWQFLEGKEEPGKSYCAKNGLVLKVVNDSNICARFLTSSCAVCILKDGSEIEVTKLMGLTFDETTCGDKHCSFPETSKSCPKDCSSGNLDMFCDGLKDGTCDPDCDTLKENDPDCKTNTTYPIIWIISGIVLVVGVFLVIILLKKRK